MQHRQSLNDQLNYYLIIVVVVASAWVLFFTLNHLAFKYLHVSPLISLIFLPAGIRLISVLLVRHLAILGLFVGGMLTNLSMYPEIALTHQIMISLISAVNPYVAYLTANSLLNVKSSLQAISSKQLLLMSLIYALFNAGAHNVYFYLSEITNELVMNSIKMFIGDFIGAVVMLHLFSSWIYLLKKYAPGKAP